MAIPDFQTLMLPLLRHLGDGKEHTNQETLDALAKEFRQSEAELAQLLPSGTQGLFRNRAAWAKAHFKKAGLVESPRRSVYKITPVGLDVLAKNPGKIDLRPISWPPRIQDDFKGSNRDSGGT
jgi:restriction system protein